MSYRLKFVALSISLALSGIMAVHGQEEEFDESLGDFYGDEEFVSIATGSKQPIRKAPSVASVITYEEIRQLGARNLKGVLESVPGIHVAPSSLSRMSPVYSVRGIHTGLNPQVLLLFNGLPFQHLATGGKPTLFTMPVESIERIEVIRGPGSAVYGADAYAGVINIIAKKDENSERSIGGLIGSFGTHELWYQKFLKLNSWNVSLSLETYETDGDESRIADSDLQTIFDSIFMTSASLTPSYLRTNDSVQNMHANFNNENFDIDFWFWNQDKVGIGSGGAQTIDPVGFQNASQSILDISYKSESWFDGWDSELSFSYKYLDDDSKFVLFPAGAVLPIGGDGNLNLTAPVGVSLFSEGYIGNPKGIDEASRLEFTLTTNNLEQHKLRINLGANNQSLDTSEFKNFGPGVLNGTELVVSGELVDVSNTPFVFVEDVERDIWFLSVQDEWQVAPDWSLTLGARYDDYSDFGSTFNPRASLVWATNLNLTTKLLYGSAFRAPSFQELYIKNNPVSIGNAGLNPETIDTLELVFDYRSSGDSSYILNLFSYKAEGLIEFIPDGTGNSIAQNARAQDGYGIELEAKWKLSESLKLNANYSMQNSEDSDTNSEISEAPGRQLFVKIDWKASDSLVLNSTINRVMDRKRREGDVRAAVDDYTMIDLGLTYLTGREGIEVALKSKNVLDEDAYDPSDGLIPNDFLKEGRSVWLELRYKY
ncbi:TonB-dependent siderophore receptor [Aliikangiella sp. G2MR2-5]|uniref:TonB-dependent receptor plug domain-containing protein n=1 Tax=Aliikangiella sp. G2MR2-5 TaxID=2788943 RepID=UPI0018AC20A4|nr:TonB-dependent receptor [Aliikangiella sp. G2MR2-5]